MTKIIICRSIYEEDLNFGLKILNLSNIIQKNKYDQIFEVTLSPKNEFLATSTKKFFLFFEYK